MSNSNIVLRLARRDDTSRLVHIANAANAQSALHRRIAPGQDRYPLSYHDWRLNIFRQRFITPDLRIIVAEDTSTREVLGLACWAVEGADTTLYQRWVSESSWTDSLEAQVLWVERQWAQYVTDKSVDYNFVNRFVAAFLGENRSARPPCLHCHQITVDPHTQSRGVGGMLIDWAKDLATKEGLPLYLESNLEATRFYEKQGFARLRDDLVLDFDAQGPIRIPVFVWEGKDTEGRWLERTNEQDSKDARWQWKKDVLPQ